MFPQQFKSKRAIKAVILAGNNDFGRCRLASHLPTALWPVNGKPVLQNLLLHLCEQGIREAVICSNVDSQVLQEAISCVDSVRVKFLEDSLPVGTAGCLRDAAGGDKNVLMLAMQAQTMLPPDVDELVRIHQEGKCELTVMFGPNLNGGEQRGHTSEVYICEPTVLEYIPKEGYFDIKESLIPAMLRAGKAVYGSMLSDCAGNFRNKDEYLDAIGIYLENNGEKEEDFSYKRLGESRDILVSSSAEVDHTARIYGPVIVMDKATISEGAIIFGPTVVGREVYIGRGSLVESSVLWDGCCIGKDCEVRSCVADYRAVLPDGSIADSKAVIGRGSPRAKSVVNTSVSFVSDKAEQIHSSAQSLIAVVERGLPSWVWSYKLKSGVLRGLGVSIIAGLFFWCYWPELTELWDIWQRSDEYSSGILVPFLAVYVLWSKRSTLAKCRVKSSMWGLFGFIGAQLLRHFGLFFMYASAERLSIVLSIGSLILLLFGWEMFLKVSSVLVFLCLMLPLPRSVHSAVMLPLQNLATVSAVFCLEMMGYAVTREGNIIHLNGVTVAVAEACNGLRMVTAFFIVAGLVVLIARRVWWEKLIILISSLPIALLCNAVRLTVTSIAFTMLSGEKWEGLFHDFGGYAMMPLAVAVVVFELWLLNKLTKVSEEVITADSYSRA